MLEVAVTGGLRDGAKLSGRAAAQRAYGLNALPAFRCCARSGYEPGVTGFRPVCPRGLSLGFSLPVDCGHRDYAGQLKADCSSDQKPPKPASGIHHLARCEGYDAGEDYTSGNPRRPAAQKAPHKNKDAKCGHARGP